MRYFFLFLFALESLIYAAEAVAIEDRFNQSQNCKACHLHLVRDWEESWHAKSHYDSDEYFRATTDYVSRKTRKSLGGVKVQCATCHNPRISVTSTDMDYEIAAVMGLDKGTKVEKALNDETISEGINCVVCHNIEKIHTDKDASFLGIHRVEWSQSGVMTGPYDDSKSPYHKVEYRDFMEHNSNQLCFVCHANDRSTEGVVFTDMKSEYGDSQKQCVECHMGPKKLGHAATLKIDNGQRKMREIRSHGFVGAHTESMWQDALGLELSSKQKNLFVAIKNSLPHNIPSGFGAREILVEISFKSGLKEIDSKVITLTTHYKNKRGKPTIPHLAHSASEDMSIPANGEKKLKIPLVAGTTSVEVKLFYRLVNDEVRELLELKEEIWSKKSFIASGYLKIKE